MAKPIFASQQLAERNFKDEIANVVASIAQDRLQNRIKLMVGDSTEFHRHLQVLIHTDSEKTKQLARWW